MLVTFRVLSVDCELVVSADLPTSGPVSGPSNLNVAALHPGRQAFCNRRN